MYFVIPLPFVLDNSIQDKSVSVPLSIMVGKSQWWHQWDPVTLGSVSDPVLSRMNGSSLPIPRIEEVWDLTIPVQSTVRTPVLFPDFLVCLQVPVSSLFPVFTPSLTIVICLFCQGFGPSTFGPPVFKVSFRPQSSRLLFVYWPPSASVPFVPPNESLILIKQ